MTNLKFLQLSKGTFISIAHMSLANRLQVAVACQSLYSLTNEKRAVWAIADQNLSFDLEISSVFATVRA